MTSFGPQNYSQIYAQWNLNPVQNAQYQNFDMVSVIRVMDLY